MALTTEDGRNEVKAAAGDTHLGNFVVQGRFEESSVVPLCRLTFDCRTAATRWRRPQATLSWSASWSKARFEEPSAAVQADSPVQDFFLLRVSETTDGGMTKLLERNTREESARVLLLPGATPLSADAGTAGGVMTNLMTNRHTAIPDDEVRPARRRQRRRDLVHAQGTELVSACVTDSWWRHDKKLIERKTATAVVQADFLTGKGSSQV